MRRRVMTHLNRKCFYVCLAYLLLSLLLFVSTIYAKEGLKFTIDPQWMFLKDETIDKTSTMTFVPLGQTEEDWKSRFEIIQTALKNYPSTVQEAQVSLLKARQEYCPETQSEIIEQDKKSIIFDMSTRNCPSFIDQYQLTKILYGKKDVYIMIFTNRGESEPPSQKDEWLKTIRAAKIQ
jgi:hypothetical protein